MPFHPAVSGWLVQRFGRPTEVQQRAWAVTATHRHALIAAPTGSGKTLAAFLSAINDLVVGALASGLRQLGYLLDAQAERVLGAHARRDRPIQPVEVDAQEAGPTRQDARESLVGASSFAQQLLDQYEVGALPS